eukprot:s309_g5.t1
MAAPSLKQARAQLEPVAHDEMRTLVTRVIANSQLEALLAEIDVQRPDKMVRRHSPIDEDDEWATIPVAHNSPSPVRRDRGQSSSAAMPRGPPPPNPVYPNRRQGNAAAAPKGPPPPSPVHFSPGAYPGEASPGTSELFDSSSSEAESSSVRMAGAAGARDYILPTVTRHALPHGLPDLKTWGRTLLTLPKYAENKWSYKVLLEKAWHSREILSYLRWIKNTYHQDAQKPVAGKASDLAAFLIATEYPIMERIGTVGPARVLVDE